MKNHPEFNDYFQCEKTSPGRAAKKSRRRKGRAAKKIRGPVLLKNPVDGEEIPSYYIMTFGSCNRQMRLAGPNFNHNPDEAQRFSALDSPVEKQVGISIASFMA